MTATRWRALAVLGLIQFMLVVDISIVNVALPSIQRDLGFTHAGLGWVVDGYVLMAGGLLLLGGRLADIYGRRRLFLIGVGIFGLASSACGAAFSPAMLVASRFLQGAGEALAAPAALGLIVLLFPDAGERARALGVWGGLAGLGGTAGSVLSGVLTDLTSWRLIFLVNLPVALVALAMVPRLVPESRMVRASRERLDVAGALSATGGLVGIVLGLLQAARHPWLSPATLVPLAAGAALLTAMVVVEARSPHPVIPMRFFRNRTRGVAYFLNLFFTAAFFSYAFLLTLFEQQVLHLSPLESGLGYLPLGLGIGAGMGIGTALMPRIGVRALLPVSFFGVACGLLLTAGLSAGSSYLGGVLPGMILVAVGSGLSFAPIMNAALHGVTGQDSSLAAAVQNAVAQVGGALGLAGLVSLALRTSSPLSFRIAAALMVLGGLLALTLLERVGPQPRNPLAEAS